MRTRESLDALKVELDGDMKRLERVMGHNRRAWERIQSGARDYLHTAYGVIENYFLRISKLFENNLPSDRWHKALVEKMTLDIPGLRPSLFADERIRDQAMELLKFRHRVRNLYGEDLDPARTEAIQRIATDFYPSFVAAHLQFVAKLEAIGQALP